MSFDPSLTFVRLVARRPDGFVELELAVGEPALFVELILPPAAFDELCARASVTRLPDAAEHRLDP